MDRRLLPNPELKRKTICTSIKKNPGFNYQDLLKDTGFANGILSHHLRKLEMEGLLRVKRKGRLTWFFPIGSDPDRDNLIINLRKETCRNILIFLLEKKLATFVEITQAVHKSPATVSYTLKQLTEGNVVKKVPGFQKKYSLSDHDLTIYLLEKLEITEIDILCDRFANSFSYY